MAFLVSLENLITVGTLLSVTTENTLYVKEYLYDSRPSRPFYFTSNAAQDIRIDFGGGAQPTFGAIFNHNLTSAAKVRIEGNAANAWGAPTFHTKLLYREWDMWKRWTSAALQYWRFYFNDPTNPYFIRVGDAWLGEWTSLESLGVRITPGRDDGYQVVADEQVTTYGQDWDSYLSIGESFRIGLTSIENAENIAAVSQLIQEIGGPAGRFVIVPNSDLPHVYMVKMVGNPSGHRLITGDKDFREWTMELKVLTRGIQLL